MKIEIKGTGSLEEVIKSLEVTVKSLKSMESAKKKLLVEDDEIHGIWTDAICHTKITK